MRIRCHTLVNTTRKLLMVSVLFVLANFKVAKSFKVTIMLKSKLCCVSAGTQFMCFS